MTAAPEIHFYDKREKETRLTQYTLTLTGLSCAGCVARAERAAASVSGVSDVQVNLATSRAQVQVVDPVHLPALADALTDAGYPPAHLTATLRLANLSCAGCVARAEKALRAVPGVLGAAVNLATAKAELHVLRDLHDPARIHAALDAAGYPAQQDATDPAAPVPDATAGLRHRTLIAAALVAPVAIIEMAGHAVPAFHHGLFDILPLRWWWVMQAVAITVLLAGPGRDILRSGLRSLAKGAPEMNSLVALGAGAAWAWSMAVTLAPGLMPADGRVVYFESAGVIVTLILLGRWLEARAKGRAGRAITALLELQPDMADRQEGADFVARPVADLRPGDILRIAPGARVPVDGRVQDGRSHLDEAFLTGEPLPVAKGPGDPLTGGSVNGTGQILMQAEKVGADTVLARILQQVEAAQMSKLPIQALVDRIASVFVPVVMVLSALTLLVWLAFGPGPGAALMAAVSVLIIACPCAMGLATPMSVLVGTGRAAELGVLFRNGRALQQLGEVAVVAFDKTGTLTEGRPRVTGIVAARDDALALVAGAEAGSSHPLARAIMDAAATRGIAPGTVRDVVAEPGLGLRAQTDHGALLVGSARYLAGAGIDLPDDPAPAGASSVHAALGGRFLARFDLTDPPRADARAVIDALHARGLKTAIISGDGADAVQAVADALGIDRVIAGVLPDEKRSAIKALRDDLGPVAFVGDGINDGPALAEADAGLAMGSGADVAIEAAEAVIRSTRLDAVVSAYELSRATIRNIWQNLGWAFLYNVLLIPVAAGILYPLTGWLLSPMLAAGAMAASSVLVVTNALRLRGIRPPA